MDDISRLPSSVLSARFDAILRCPLLVWVCNPSYSIYNKSIILANDGQ